MGAPGVERFGEGHVGQRARYGGAPRASMLRMRNHASAGLLLAMSVSVAALNAQDHKSAAVEASLQALEHSLYFVLPPKQVPAGKKAGLVVVLPGGDGSREFLPWVENSLLPQRPDDCVGVLVTAVKWQAEQQIV